MKELLVGFDARNPEEARIDSWPADARKTFLLKEDSGVKVLSIDAKIWPSIFQILKIERPATRTTYMQYLWANLEELQVFIASSESLSRSKYWYLAFTQFYDESTLDENRFTSLPLHPPTIQDDWIFLGYDVSADPPLSGLTNMGYGDEEKSYLLKHFARFLNMYHLFDDVEVAHEFAKWSDAREPLHGPFFVTGLYHIPASP